MANDDRAIHDLYARLMQAWTDNDAVAYGAWTGRQAMRDAHDKLFRGVLAGSSLVGELESIRHIAPGVAVANGTASVLMPWRSKLPKRRLSRQTLVVSRTDDGLQLTALQNGRVRPVRIPAPDSIRPDTRPPRRSPRHRAGARQSPTIRGSRGYGRSARASASTSSLGLCDRPTRHAAPEVIADKISRIRRREAVMALDQAYSAAAGLTPASGG